MKLTSFSATNYKNIRTKETLSSLGSLNALIGPNNEGKSSFLEALYTARWIRGPLMNPDDWTRYIHERFTDKKDLPFELELVFTLDTDDCVLPGKEEEPVHIDRVSCKLMWTGQLGIRNPNHFLPTDITFRVRRVNGSGEAQPRNIQLFFLDARNGTVRVPNVALHDALRIENLTRLPEMPSQAWSATAAHVLFTGEVGREGETLRFCDLLGVWASRLVYVPSHRHTPPVGNVGVDRSNITGLSLPAVLHFMRNNEEGRYREFEKMIQRLIPSVKKVYTHLEDANQVSIRVASGDVANTAEAHRLDTVGSGVSELIWLVARIWLSDAGSTVLVEEPERGLHASSQRTFMEAARAHAAEQGKTLLWSTHSTILAPLAKSCSVHLVTLHNGNESKAMLVGEGERGAVREALGHTNLDLYGYDLVILWDGESESSALPAIAEHVLGTQVFNAIRFQSFDGDLGSKVDVVGRLIESLGAAQIKVIIFADDDEGTRKAIDTLRDRFSDGKSWTDDRVHVWDCGVKGDTGGSRGAEFEDNFSHTELICAANAVGGGSEMTVDELAKRAEANPAQKISKILERYFYETHHYGLSKPQLNKLLGQQALKKIIAQQARGRNGLKYEFEDAITNLRKLLPQQS